MFIAHLPAGYLLAQGFRKTKGLLAVSLLGSIFPDFDLFYFFLVDHSKHHHHSYWIHFPIVWLGLLIATSLWLLFKKHSHSALLAFVFCLSGLVHILLDGVVGDIMLWAPFSKKFYALAKVEAIYQPWWLNFFLHWSFLLELLIIATAIAVVIKKKSQQRGEIVFR